MPQVELVEISELDLPLIVRRRETRGPAREALEEDVETEGRLIILSPNKELNNGCTEGVLKYVHIGEKL
jgi:hypothetical protein